MHSNTTPATPAPRRNARPKDSACSASPSGREPRVYRSNPYEAAARSRKVATLASAIDHPGLDAYHLESILINATPHYPCLSDAKPPGAEWAAYCFDVPPAPWEPKRERGVRCSAVCFGCDELREVAAAIDGDEFCAPCAVALCAFATEAA